MKKRNILLSLVLAFVMVFALTACEKEPDNGKDKDPPPKNPADTAWIVEQVGGADGTSKTTSLKFTFGKEVETLLLADITLTGAAKLKNDAVPVKDAADAKIWTLAVTATDNANAEIKITKTGIDNALKAVRIYYVTAAAGPAANANGFPAGYTGTVFVDANYPASMPEPRPDKPNGQPIPGKVVMAYYDVGGQGVTYNDTNGANAGSGALNGGNEYKNAFRKGNPVPDTSYMKQGFDMSNSNKVRPDALDLMYIGWTNAGEWLKITVDIQVTGVYEVLFLYTKNDANSKISIDFDGGETFVAEPSQTTDYHHWNKEVVFEEISLQEGKSLLTFSIVDWGSMNLCYLEFKLVD